MLFLHFGISLFVEFFTIGIPRLQPVFKFGVNAPPVSPFDIFEGIPYPESSYFVV
jgi:hypothetical protein